MAAVAGAREVFIGGLALHLATVADLPVLKLTAAEDSSRQPPKRRQDLMDIITLAEEHLECAATVPNLKQRVQQLAAILTI